MLGTNNFTMTLTYIAIQAKYILDVDQPQKWQAQILTSTAQLTKTKLPSSWRIRKLNLMRWLLFSLDQI